jgi:molybdopterin converting factor small subunit
MNKIVIFTIFTVLMIFSIQQITYSEESSEKKDRETEVNDAHKVFKRDLPVKNNTNVIEEEEKKPEVKKILSKLKKLLPTEDKLEEITHRVIWKYVDKQSNFDEETGIETMSGLLRDITRVYDPIVNKYKVSTIQIEIIKYEDIYELDYYWDEVSSNSLEKIFNNAYVIGSPTESIDCMFNYSIEGAVTICKTDEYLLQSVIYDKYQEHFEYNKLKTGHKKLELSQDEMTSRIVEEIIKNILKNKDIEKEFQLYKILESNRDIIEKKYQDKERKNIEEQKLNKENQIIEERNKNKSLGIEKDKKYGIQNFSCIKDEFGLVTISGQFNNNEIKKDKVILEILFLDYEQNIIFKNTANLLEIDTFETKRFLGNTKIKESFSSCTINTKN